MSTGTTHTELQPGGINSNYCGQRHWWESFRNFSEGLLHSYRFLFLCELISAVFSFEKEKLHEYIEQWRFIGVFIGLGRGRVECQCFKPLFSTAVTTFGRPSGHTCDTCKYKRKFRRLWQHWSIPRLSSGTHVSCINNNVDFFTRECVAK